MEARTAYLLEFWRCSYMAVSFAECVMQVVEHCWGEDITPLLPAPDLITGADVVYQQEHFDALVTTLQQLAAPHTLIYLAFKLRGECVNNLILVLGITPASC